MDSARLRFLSILFILLVVVSTGFAQTSTSATKATAAISGRITVEGQPAQGVEVMLRPSGNQMMEMGIGGPPPTTVTTEADGRYKFSSVAAGAYRITAY